MIWASGKMQESAACRWKWLFGTIECTGQTCCVWIIPFDYYNVPVTSILLLFPSHRSKKPGLETWGASSRLRPWGTEERRQLASASTCSHGIIPPLSFSYWRRQLLSWNISGNLGRKLYLEDLLTFEIQSCVRTCGVLNGVYNQMVYLPSHSLLHT